MASTTGERLREARKAKGLSRKDVCEALNIPYSTYANHENGDRGYAGYIDRYADFLLVRAEWLRTGNGPMQRQKKTPIQEIFDDLPETGREELIRYGEYLKSKAA